MFGDLTRSLGREQALFLFIEVGDYKEDPFKRSPDVPLFNMTIALVTKVYDGLVFAADSASTIMLKVNGCPLPHAQNVFNNGEKITNLHRALPLGIITWGLGTVDTHSINWHGKELRRRFEGEDARFSSWRLDPDNYQLVDVANLVRDYFLSFPVFATPTTSAFGLLIAGYSSDGDIPQAYSIESITPTQAALAAQATVVPSAPEADPSGVQTPSTHEPNSTPTAAEPNSTPTAAEPNSTPGGVASNVTAGLTQPIERLIGDEVILFFGQPEALERLTVGYSAKIREGLVKVGARPEDLEAILGVMRKYTQNTLVTQTMPIQDVLDLAHFLVDTTIKYVRFSAGPNTVGGSIDLAAITRHEGFKWVNRKHYYPSELNP